MIRLACSKCDRTVTRPVWVGGSAYGSSCAQTVTGPRLGASRGTAKRSRRVVQSEQVEHDPNQLLLQLEEVTQ